MQSEFGKAFKKASKVGGHWAVAVRNFLAYKVAKMSFSRPEGDRDESWDLGVYFLRNFFSLSSLHFSPKNTSKNLRFNLSLNNQKVVFLLSIFLSLVLYLGFEALGCGCRFLATIYTHCFSSHGCSFIVLPSMFYGFF